MKQLLAALLLLAIDCGGAATPADSGTCVPNAGLCNATSDCCDGTVGLSRCQGSRCCRYEGSPCAMSAECCLLGAVSLACIEGACRSSATSSDGGTCGLPGFPCCPTARCGDALVCVDGLCRCGGDGEPCCGGSGCNPGLVCGAVGRCGVVVSTCGAVGQSCCTGDQCDEGGLCFLGRCYACGANGQRCCAGDACDVGFRCLGETCVPM